jgi:hypothetical protein
MLLNRPFDDPSKEPAENEERFVSDTQKIIHRHLADEDDLITEEDIRNVRVGMVPPADEQTTPASADREFEELEKELNEETPDDADKSDKPVTPWDVKGE